VSGAPAAIEQHDLYKRKSVDREAIRYAGSYARSIPEKHKLISKSYTKKVSEIFGHVPDSVRDYPNLVQQAKT
jgi:hypothetical protein